MQVGINSLSEYVLRICEINHTLNKYDVSKNEILLFRGQSSTEYQLIPSLGRNGFINHEANLINTAMNKRPDIFKQDMMPLQRLALMQHYGIPTRLLDVTENPLVALYFACCDNNTTDAEVIVFRHNDIRSNDTFFNNAISESYLLIDGITKTTITDFILTAANRPYYLLEKHYIEKKHPCDEDKIRWIKECCKELIFVNAPFYSLRQKMQSGRYILFPNDIDNTKDCFDTKIEAIRKDNPAIECIVVIPSKIKKTILEDLKQFGISCESLFGDSIDKMCIDIKDNYQQMISNYKYNLC